MNKLKMSNNLGEFIKKMKSAEYEMQSGKPESYISLWQNSNEITSIGANGTIMLGEQVLLGPKNVSLRCCEVKNSKYSNQKVVVLGEGNIAYTIWLNEGENLVVGSNDYVLEKMSVTHILHLGKNGWEIIHRHNTWIK